jgi:hypothetical protein
MLIIYHLADLRTKNFILNDRDGYVRRLSYSDLRVRGGTSHEDYIKKYINSIIPRAYVQRALIHFYTIEADIFLKSLESPYIKNIASIPWRICVTDGTIEFGYPHTRGDIIFIPERCLQRSRREIVRTLIHEKIHVYQKLNKYLFNKALTDNDFVCVGIKDGPKNPDTDNKIWVKSDGSKLREHPNEYVAYAIAQQYFAYKKLNNKQYETT